MKLIADENVEYSIVNHLRKKGCDVVYVAEKYQGYLDSDILSIATTENRILLTSDNDFGEMVFRRGELSVGVVLMRFTSEDAKQKIKGLEHLFKYHVEKLYHHFTVINESQIRIRPIGE